MNEIPLHDADNTVRIDVGRIYIGGNGGGFINAPNDAILEFVDRRALHQLIDEAADRAEKQLATRQTGAHTSKAP